MANEERFYDKIVSEVIENPKDNVQFQAGFAAAKAGELRDESKGLDWILGFDEYFNKQ